MLDKPRECRGCPFFGDGKGFVPDRYDQDAALLVMAQNPGDDEEHGRLVVGWSGKEPLYEPVTPQPLVGKTGWEFRRNYLPLTGETERGVSVGNVLRCRWRHSNDLPAQPSVIEAAITHCQRAYFRPPKSTKVILAMGNPAKWALTGLGTVRSGIEEWRGWAAPLSEVYNVGYTIPTHIWTPRSNDVPVVMTLHLADLFREPMMKIPAKADWQKVSRILQGKWPRPMPMYNMTGEPGMWQSGSAFDTEFDERGALKMYSVCTPDFRVFAISPGEHDASLVPKSPVSLVMQNAPADMAHGVRLGLSLAECDDTMLMHSVLWPALPHNLNFLGSVYSDINRWKHLAQINPREYSAGDAWGTQVVFQALLREMEKDPDAKNTYYSFVRPLSRIIAFQSSQTFGLQVNPDRVKRVINKLKQEMDELSVEASATVGYQISLASPAQVAFHLYTLNRNKAPRARRKRS